MFVSDLRRTFAAWGAQPMLPLTVLAVAATAGWLTSLDGWPALAGLAAIPLYAGFLGTQRVWYARAWQGRGVAPREVVRLSLGFVGEYVALALLMFTMGLIVLIPMFFLFGRDVAVPVQVVFIDVLCTFATSAVALDDQNAGDAISTSWRLLRRGFPHNLPHALLPPMALYALTERRGWVVVLAEVVAFVARGVTTSYYVREAAPPPVAPELAVERNPINF